MCEPENVLLAKPDLIQFFQLLQVYGFQFYLLVLKVFVCSDVAAGNIINCLPGWLNPCVYLFSEKEKGNNLYLLLLASSFLFLWLVSIDGNFCVDFLCILIVCAKEAKKSRIYDFFFDHVGIVNGLNWPEWFGTFDCVEVWMKEGEILGQ